LRTGSVSLSLKHQKDRGERERGKTVSVFRMRSTFLFSSFV
jgi:hypothetical protein